MKSCLYQSPHGNDIELHWTTGLLPSSALSSMLTWSSCFSIVLEVLRGHHRKACGAGKVTGVSSLLHPNLHFCLFGKNFYMRRALFCFKKDRKEKGKNELYKSQIL
jgi:hypothetical protein